LKGLNRQPYIINQPKGNSQLIGKRCFTLEKKEYEEITVKLTLSNDYLEKLDRLINIKRIFSSRAEAFRRALELLFEKYEETLSA
jgi:hypothetical protein